MFSDPRIEFRKNDGIEWVLDSLGYPSVSWTAEGSRARPVQIVPCVFLFA